MPLYEYKCTSCGEISEIRHGFSENPSRSCPSCGAMMARVFSAAPIVFKGSGFYVTDSRKSDSKSSAPKAAPSKSAESKSGESKGSESKEGGAAEATGGEATGSKGNGGEAKGKESAA
jgi:putative FmdB family regulatory protein